MNEEYETREFWGLTKRQSEHVTYIKVGNGKFKKQKGRTKKDLKQYLIAC